MDDELAELYERISACQDCPRTDHVKALRRTDAVDSRTDVLIISEALAPEQLRRSGVNFFQDDGEIGSTGTGLESFLDLFGRTVRPSRNIRLSDTVTITASAQQLIPVYNSEMAQCFPGWKTVKKEGKKLKKIRPPSPIEVQTCLNKGFLKSEIELIQPKLILLMGGTSYKFFFKEFLGRQVELALVKYIISICEGAAIPRYRSGDRQIPVIPIVHFSTSAQGYWKQIGKQRLVGLIAEQLRG